ncbi:hypothetical protein [Spiroplasma turonicum]|uniref:Transmembrane protein n=1 Tax=Spiroplasma turonicum TaxID=216946 RepID=A0A0K1P832_9MOLU|nr:hypothetical protein [Spiroplasma turonicum]AKU80032.1 hypothetical protein STURON_00786 [Spiroplasma turonicum]ALX71034.1 hypothetical protein STURO_v1c07830 [Spiroplasma turonicum]
MKEKNYQLLLQSIYLLYIVTGVGSIIYNIINDRAPNITQSYTETIVLYSFTISYTLILTITLFVLTLMKIKIIPEIVELISIISFIMFVLSILTTKDGVIIVFLPFFFILAILFLFKEKIVKGSNINENVIENNQEEKTSLRKNLLNGEFKKARNIFYFNYLAFLLLEIWLVYSIIINQNVFSLGKYSFIIYAIVLVLLEFSSFYIRTKMIYIFKVEHTTNFDIKLYNLCKITMFIPICHYFFWIPCFIIKIISLKKRKVILV